eukprot:813010-Prymnesium_polylepis.2
MQSAARVSSSTSASTSISSSMSVSSPAMLSANALTASAASTASPGTETVEASRPAGEGAASLFSKTWRPLSADGRWRPLSADARWRPLSADARWPLSADAQPSAPSDRGRGRLLPTSGVSKRA